MPPKPPGICLHPGCTRPIDDLDADAWFCQEHAQEMQATRTLDQTAIEEPVISPADEATQPVPVDSYPVTEDDHA